MPISCPQDTNRCSEMTACGFLQPFPAVRPQHVHLQRVMTKKRLPMRLAKFSGHYLPKHARMSQNPASHEPVEDGVTLPKPESANELTHQSKWLQSEMTNWLNAEWHQSGDQPIHDEIGKRTGMIYARQRMEGEDDLSNVMLAIGSELEGMDFSQSFVNPWNVANRAAELLLENCAGERVKWTPSFPSQKRAEVEKPASATREISTRRRRTVFPSLADAFARLKFLRDVLDGNVSAEVINGAIAVVMGYKYDAKSGTWDGSQVEDEHFRAFGNEPPDILGDENSSSLTATLLYLEGLLGLEEDTTGELAESLQTIIDTLHGSELTKVQMEDRDDHAFRKRSIVAKWLHLLGGF